MRQQRSWAERGLSPGQCCAGTAALSVSAESRHAPSGGGGACPAERRVAAGRQGGGRAGAMVGVSAAVGFCIAPIFAVRRTQRPTLPPPAA
jgi:hypothetical protein